MYSLIVGTSEETNIGIVQRYTVKTIHTIINQQKACLSKAPYTQGDINLIKNSRRLARV